MKSSTCLQSQLVAAAELRDAVEAMTFAPPVAAMYNPLTYAWDAFATYLERFASGPKRVLFLGMNPGPWGMAQTGIPFGEVSVVRDWMGLRVPVGRPEREHPSYPVQGLDCPRSEVSGRRLWGLFRSRFNSPESFFREHLVVNYCPLLFIAASRRKDGSEGGRNLTPDHLPAAEAGPLHAACGRHLRAVAAALRPEWVVGVGAFASSQAQTALGDTGIKITRILHPSPASPQSNADWAGTAERQLVEAGVWE